MQLLFNSWSFLLLFLPAMLLGWWPSERRIVRFVTFTAWLALFFVCVQTLQGTRDALFVVPLFAPALLLGWWVNARRPHLRLGYLAFMSWLFYVLSYHEGVQTGLVLLPLMLLSTTVDYWAGRAIQREIEAGNDKHGRARTVLIAALVFNLGLLAIFKYAGFFATSLNAVWGLLTSGGDAVSVPDIILPIGISFYTFNSMSYTIDIYRERVKPARNMLDYAAFVALFPHLIAGPIVRYSDIDEQLRSLNTKLTSEMAARGLWFLAIGLFKKVVIANALAGHVDRLYASAGDLSMVGGWSAALGYALQLYFDFSAYSDMAVGLALLLGFQFPQNFNSPYKALNPSDFWRRWHMSLSRWLTDYLYITMGGNRHGKLKTLRNLFLTMFLGGLWHGAGWVFVLWGLGHGVGLVVHRVASDAGFTPPWRWLNRLLCFVFVVILWVPFRSGSVDLLAAGKSTSTMRAMLGAMFGANAHGTNFAIVGAGLVVLAATTALAVVLHRRGASSAGSLALGAGIVASVALVAASGLLGLDDITKGDNAGGVTVPIRFAALVAALLAFVNVAPNLWEYRFRPSRRLALGVAVLATWALLNLNAPSPFLYFQF